MLRSFLLPLVAFCLLSACSSATTPPPTRGETTPSEEPPTPDEDTPKPFTAAEVDALFQRGDCVRCHNAKNDGPDMRSVAELANMPSGSRKNSDCKESRFRFLIVPGDHEGSLVWRKVAGSHDCGESMPKGGAAPFTRVEIERLALYIDRLGAYE